MVKAVGLESQCNASQEGVSAWGARWLLPWHSTFPPGKTRIPSETRNLPISISKVGSWARTGARKEWQGVSSHPELRGLTGGGPLRVRSLPVDSWLGNTRKGRRECRTRAEETDGKDRKTSAKTTSLEQVNTVGTDQGCNATTQSHSFSQKKWILDTSRRGRARESRQKRPSRRSNGGPDNNNALVCTLHKVQVIQQDKERLR